MRTGLISLAAVVAALVIGCATTDVTAITNPQYKGLSLNKVLVSAQFQDLQTRKTFEHQFVQKLIHGGQDAVAAMDLLPPIKQYSNDEVAQILLKAGVDAAMIITLTDASTQQVYVPQSSYTTGSANVYGNSIYSTARTNTYGGYYVSKPRVRFEVDLLYAKNGDVIWKATTYTRGNAFANVDTISESLSAQVVDNYIAYRTGTPQP